MRRDWLMFINVRGQYSRIITTFLVHTDCYIQLLKKCRRDDPSNQLSKADLQVLNSHLVQQSNPSLLKALKLGSHSAKIHGLLLLSTFTKKYQSRCNYRPLTTSYSTMWRAEALCCNMHKHDRKGQILQKNRVPEKLWRHLRDTSPEPVIKSQCYYAEFFPLKK